MTTDIIIPCYNQAQYLPEAINSVLGQSDPNWKLHIVIDASPDNSLLVAESWHFLEPEKIIVYDLKENVGLTNARNYAVQKCFNEFLLFLDSDDKLDPTYLEKTTQVLRDNPDIAVCYSDTQHFGDANTCWLHKEYNFHDLLLGNFLCYCSLIRRSAFDAVGGLDINNNSGMEDYTLWLTLGSKGYYAKHFPEKLFWYRIHSQSMTQSPYWQKLQNIYYCYNITKFPMLYPKEWYQEAKKTMDGLPKNFMQLNRFQREEVLKQNGI